MHEFKPEFPVDEDIGSGTVVKEKQRDYDAEETNSDENSEENRND